jgi:hypothetical protein
MLCHEIDFDLSELPVARMKVAEAAAILKERLRRLDHASKSVKLVGTRIAATLMPAKQSVCISLEMPDGWTMVIEVPASASEVASVDEDAEASATLLMERTLACLDHAIETDDPLHHGTERMNALTSELGAMALLLRAIQRPGRSAMMASAATPWTPIAIRVGGGDLDIPEIARREIDAAYPPSFRISGHAETEGRDVNVTITPLTSIFMPDEPDPDPIETMRAAARWSGPAEEPEGPEED